MSEPLQLEPVPDTGRTPCQRVWRAVLSILLADAAAYAQGKQCVIGCKVDPDELKAAYDDLVTCGPMLQYVCAMSGDDAVFVSERVREWLGRQDAA